MLGRFTPGRTTTSYNSVIKPSTCRKCGIPPDFRSTTYKPLRALTFSFARRSSSARPERFYCHAAGTNPGWRNRHETPHRAGNRGRRRQGQSGRFSNQSCQIHRCPNSPAITGPAVSTIRVATQCPDNQVVKTIDIAGTSDKTVTEVTRIDTESKKTY